MTNPKEPLKAVFAPGFFDSPALAGLSEAERAELVAEITRMVESGAILEQGRELDPNDPEDAEAFEAIERALSHGTRHQ